MPLTTGKKIAYSIVPALAILMCLFAGALLVFFMLFFGPLNRSFLSGVNGLKDLWALLVFVPFFLVLFAIWFNFRIIRVLFGGSTPEKWAWLLNTIIVVIGCIAIAGADVLLLARISTEALSSIPGLLILGVVAAIMLYPYWLRHKFPEQFEGYQMLNQSTGTLPSDTPMP